MSDDLISRRAAIDYIDAVFPVDPMKSEYAQGIACGAALAKTYIKQLPSAQPDLSEHSTWFLIGETLVDESKKDITAEQAVDKIRGYMLRMKKPEPPKGAER